MKFVFALLFLVAVPATLTMASFSPSIEEPLHQYEDDCGKESGLDLAQIETIRKNQQVPDNEASNKWAKCMMQKHNVIKSDESINTDVSTITIPADTDTVIRAFPTCSKLSGRDIADTGRLMMNCYLQNSGGLVMGIIPRI